MGRVRQMKLPTIVFFMCAILFSPLSYSEVNMPSTVTKSELIPSKDANEQESPLDKKWDKAKETTKGALFQSKKAGEAIWEASKESSKKAWSKSKDLSNEVWDKVKEKSSDMLESSTDKIEKMLNKNEQKKIEETNNNII